MLMIVSGLIFIIVILYVFAPVFFAESFDKEKNKFSSQGDLSEFISKEEELDTAMGKFSR
ncbi:MAG: hypothetical protein R3A13_01765 [Bdellovibrionota bacterium]